MIIKDEAGRERAFEKIAAINLSKPWELEIKPYKKNRTAAQSRLMWMWFGLWGQDLGYTKDEMYDVAVDQLWPIHEEELTCNGISVARQRRTSNLNTKDFADFLNNIDMKASETGTVLPHPEDLYCEAMGIARK
jgi:hypothetical protein